MKPFKLQVVLDYRKRLADQAQQEVAACMAHKNAVAAARKEAEKDRQRLCRELDSAKTSAVHLEEILLYEQCICAKQRHVDQLGERLAKAEAEVAEKQQKLVEARQKKKILEKKKKCSV